jgi:hypothetical protein
MKKNNFKVGQRVTCFRPHDKSTPLTGTIKAIPEGDEDIVHVVTDEGNGSVSRLETIGASDVTPLDETQNAASTGATSFRPIR